MCGLERQVSALTKPRSCDTTTRIWSFAKRTAASHGDRADLDAALALVSEAAGHNNNALAEDAHHATLAALQRSIFDPKGELNVLDWPGRRLVRGPLELKKLCRKYGVMQWPHRKLRSLEKKIASLRAEQVFSSAACLFRACVRTRCESCLAARTLVTVG